MPPIVANTHIYPLQVYVWARRHQYVNLSFLGIFNFTAPYLPWVLLAFSVVLRSSPVVDLLGMLAGIMLTVCCASTSLIGYINGSGLSSACCANASLACFPTSSCTTYTGQQSFLQVVHHIMSSVPG